MPCYFVADGFHTKKLCSSLSSREVRFYTENGHFAFVRPFGGSGATYDVHHSICCSQKPHATRKPDGSIRCRTGVMSNRNLHCGNRYFGRFRLLWPWPWPDDLHIRIWPVLSGYIPDHPDVQIRTFYVKAFESYRLTDRHTYIGKESTEILSPDHAASPVVYNMKRAFFCDSWATC